MSDEKRMSWDFFSNRRKAEKEKKSRINENPKETGEGMKKDGSTGTRTNESNGRKGNTIQRTIFPPNSVNIIATSAIRATQIVLINHYPL